MSQVTDTLFSELRSLIADLGKDGGRISPSIYDTAQVLRLCPPLEGVEPGLDWLKSQQEPDGGWGDPAVPLARHVPTLAAVLALHTYKDKYPTKASVDAGMKFLHNQADEWQEAHLDNYPIAVELIFPNLIEDAIGLGFEFSLQSYNELFAVGAKKREHITRRIWPAGTPPVYSWEVLGNKPILDTMDKCGSVGTSPSATAAWLHAASGYSELGDVWQKGQDYLEKASKSTGLQIPGVVPVVWPINRFEQQYSLYSLIIAGIEDHAEVRDMVRLQAQDLRAGFTQHGISWNDLFAPDGDDTAVASIVLKKIGYSINVEKILNDFRYGELFATFMGEINPSIFTNAHALHALASPTDHLSGLQTFLLNRRNADNRWPADKWHSSWLYTTLEIMLAFDNIKDYRVIQSIGETLPSNQHADGGWGITNKSTTTETAYSLLMLNILNQRGLLNQDSQTAMRNGYHWLLSKYLDGKMDYQNKRWIGKELYKPYRIDRAFELSALLAITISESKQEIKGARVPVLT